MMSEKKVLTAADREVYCIWMIRLPVVWQLHFSSRASFFVERRFLGEPLHPLSFVFFALSISRK